MVAERSQDDGRDGMMSRIGDVGLLKEVLGVRVRGDELRTGALLGARGATAPVDLRRPTPEQWRA
jgi:hypothetical protein